MTVLVSPVLAATVDQPLAIVNKVSPPPFLYLAFSFAKAINKATTSGDEYWVSMNSELKPEVLAVIFANRLRKMAGVIRGVARGANDMLARLYGECGKRNKVVVMKSNENWADHVGCRSAGGCSRRAPEESGNRR